MNQNRLQVPSLLSPKNPSSPNGGLRRGNSNQTLNSVLNSGRGLTKQSDDTLSQRRSGYIVNSPVAVDRREDLDLQKCIEKGKKPYFDAMPMIYEDSQAQLGPLKVATYGFSEKFEARIKTKPWSYKTNTFNYHKDPNVDQKAINALGGSDFSRMPDCY